ncbi:hypothetical protein [Streptomyces sp. NPDC050585]|uniref:hypothetical protein n=1 Tax=Streptomyces sp. NPDC050585 TaxID=3365632 RepID=UPI0037A94F25
MGYLIERRGRSDASTARHESLIPWLQSKRHGIVDSIQRPRPGYIPDYQGTLFVGANLAVLVDVTPDENVDFALIVKEAQYVSELLLCADIV